MIVTCPACEVQNRVPAARLGERAVCGGCQTVLPLDKPLVLTTAEEFDDLTRDSPLPVLVDFWAPWCGPCRRVAPHVAGIAAAHQGRLVVAKVNTDELQEIARRLEITTIPTFALYRGGQLVQREVGSRDQRGLERAFGLG